MYHFVAFSWNSTDSANAVTAQQFELLLSDSPDWRCVLDAPGLRVLHKPQARGAYHCYILRRNGGVILGRIFNRCPNEVYMPSDPTFDDKESNLLVESKGRRLVERYWGHYVAFLHESDGRRNFILRDPTGGLPCFFSKASGVDVIASDIADYVRLKLTPFSVDWNHLAAYFRHGRLITKGTGFKEVTQLYAGECVAIKDGSVCESSFYWNPIDVYQSNVIEAPDHARSALRGVVQHCVGAWSSCYGSIVHELSGGLDSSIVAACLSKTNHRAEVLCFHYYTEMPGGDERPYARVAARSAKHQLVEGIASVSERTLRSQLETSLLATPAVLGFLTATELLKQRLIAERHAGAVFSGQGGDHLFQHGKDKLIAAEYVHRYGLRPGLMNVVADTSRMTSESVWSVLGTVVRYGLLRRTFDPYAIFQPPQILSSDASSSKISHLLTHPWVENARHLPAVKIQQIFDIVDCQMFYSIPYPHADQIHPLISQPIIELCLQIPSYVLAHRGVARGLVREAFKDDVPPEIIHRQSKGETSSYFVQLLIQNASFLRELLLDGLLIKEGILDRRELEKSLSEEELVRGSERRSILYASRAEAWLRSWADETRPTVT